MHLHTHFYRFIVPPVLLLRLSTFFTLDFIAHLCIAFSALALLAGGQEEHPARKN